LAIRVIGDLGYPLHQNGTVVVIQGPRFSTAAESGWFTAMGWHVINMTEYPEITLAREKEICYCAVGLVTDYDAGLVAAGRLKPVSAREIIAIFKRNIDRAKKMMIQMIRNWPAASTCSCQQTLKGARFG
jgi:5'-methylthioadenosine phosphorylase